MNLVKSFSAGFVSTLVFHQGLLALLHSAGRTTYQPYNMAPTGPLHVPQVLSLAFWGGVWGIVLWLVIRRLRGASYWFTAIVLGAIAPTAVALLVVFPLKGQSLASSLNPTMIVGGLLLNGAWGLGVALLMRVLARGR